MNRSTGLTQLACPYQGPKKSYPSFSHHVTVSHRNHKEGHKGWGFSWCQEVRKSSIKEEFSVCQYFTFVCVVCVGLWVSQTKKKKNPRQETMKARDHISLPLNKRSNGTRVSQISPVQRIIDHLEIIMYQIKSPTIKSHSYKLIISYLFHKTE